MKALICSILLALILALVWHAQPQKVHLEPQSKESFVLAEDGKSSLVILVAPDASKQVTDAAGVLQRYLKKCIGVELPILTEANGGPAIHVGRTAYVEAAHPKLDDLDEEGFHLEGKEDNQFIIVGASDWGTEFGVYEFLERYLGVRWLMPGDDGEVAPQHSTLVISGEPVRQSPVYNLSRTISGSLNPVFDWARFNRIRFGRLERAHNLNRLFPPSQFAKTNPGFYPILNGKRFIPPNDAHYQWQPNFSEPALVDAAVMQIDRFFQVNPTTSSFSLSTNDTGNFDESQPSLARRVGGRNALDFVDVSNDYFPWANAVVEKVLEKYPDKWFGAYAYRETLEPPTNVDHFNPRLVPHLTYERLKWSDPKLRAADQELTKRWAEVAPTVGWYDYLFGVNYLVPRVWPHLMQDYLSWGAANHVRSFHGDYLPNWAGEGPKAWIMTKLLWNPHQDVDRLLDDWYRNAVGEAAAPMLRAYFEIWEKFWTEEIPKSNWVQMEGGDGALYMRFSDPGYLIEVTSKQVDQADKLMREVSELAETPAQKKRAARMIKMWEFYRASIRTYQAEAMAMQSQASSEEEVLAMLSQAPAILEQSTQRTALLESFNDEDGLFTPHFYSRPLLMGTYWGSSMIWNARPWLVRSERARSLVEALATTQQGAGLLARKLLLAEKGLVKPMLKNASFEEGLRHWKPRIIPPSKGEFRAVEGGEEGQTLLAEGIKRGLIQQEFPYQSGGYYLFIRARLPEVYRGAKVSFRFLPIGKTWRDKGYSKTAVTLPSYDLPLKAGEWATFEFPFDLPENRTIEEIALCIDITGFPPDGKLYIDDLQVYRIEDR